MASKKVKVGDTVTVIGGAASGALTPGTEYEGTVTYVYDDNGHVDVDIDLTPDPEPVIVSLTDVPTTSEFAPDKYNGHLVKEG